MQTYHVTRKWAHGLQIETFLTHSSKIELMSHIASLIVEEENEMRNARINDPSLPVPTLMSVTIKLVQ